MADDLEAFLRQAAQRRAQRKKPAAAKPAAPRAPRQPPRTPSQTPPRPQVVEAVVVPETPPSRIDSRVDTTEFQQRAGHLGEEVGLADEAMETHLHATFDHQVGTLSDGEPDGLHLGSLDAVTEEVPTVAAEIGSLLADPRSVRQAIILSEILDRPHHRW
jgi:hypothetical protein